jgi:hypothetical protein
MSKAQIERLWFTWRVAIKNSGLEPTTRLVLFNLSTYINEEGEGAFPSIGRQAKDTGLSERTIYREIQKAEAAGFLLKGKFRMGADKREKNMYKAICPKDIKPISQDLDDGMGVLENDGLFDEKILTHCQGVEKDTDTLSGISLTHCHPNSSLNSSIKKNNIKKKSPKITLAEWEEKNGQLDTKHLKEWGTSNNLDAMIVYKAIQNFREDVVAGGYLYADYPAAFKKWHRNDLNALRKQPTTPTRML